MDTQNHLVPCCTIQPAAGVPGGAAVSVALEPLTADGAGPEPVGVAAAAGKKCSRCWNYRETVGEHKDHPEVCSRCYAVVAEAS